MKRNFSLLFILIGTAQASTVIAPEQGRYDLPRSEFSDHGSVRLDWTGQVGHESVQLFSATGEYAAYSGQRSWVGLGAALDMDGIFESFSSYLQWSLQIGRAGESEKQELWLLTTTPFISYRTEGFGSAMLWPGVRVALQQLYENDQFGHELLLENYIPLNSTYEIWRGRRLELRSYWSSLDRSPDWRLGVLARSETPSGFLALGPEAYAGFQISPNWNFGLHARASWGKIPAGGAAPDSRQLESGTRINWRTRRDLTLHMGISRTASRSAEEWIGSGGLSWCAI